MSAFKELGVNRDEIASLDGNARVIARYYLALVPGTASAAIAKTGKLLVLPGPARENDDWLKFARPLLAVTLAVKDAAEAKGRPADVCGWSADLLGLHNQIRCAVHVRRHRLAGPSPAARSADPCGTENSTFWSHHLSREDAFR